MRIKSADFAACAVKREQFPKDGLPEIALIGRSNVGKSSLINSFVNRKHLAKTSSEPGKTRTINFYRINSEFYIVDLPGYGYAKVSKDLRDSWHEMMGNYLEGRANLKAACIILDARRDPGDLEDRAYEWVKSLGLPVITVFTKTDKLSRNQLASRAAAIKKLIPAAEPVIFSAHTGEGRDDLGRRINAVLGLYQDGAGA